MHDEIKYTNWVKGERFGLCAPCLTSDPMQLTRTQMQFHHEPTFGEEKELVGNIPTFCCSLNCVRKIGRRERVEERVGWVNADPNRLHREGREFAKVWAEVHAAGPLCAPMSGNSGGQSQDSDVLPPEVAHEEISPVFVDVRSVGDAHVGQLGDPSAGGTVGPSSVHPC